MGTDRALVGGILRYALTVVALLFVTVMSACSTTPSNSVTGIVTAVDGDLTTVASFEVLSDGETLRFVPSPDGDFAFPLPHLRDHLRVGDPVVVEYAEIEGVLNATAIRDG